MTAAAAQPEPNSPAGELALSYVAQQIPVFPCRHEAEEIIDQSSGEIDTRGEKTPLLNNGFLGATLNAGLVERTWRRYPNALIGAATGSKARFFALDIDNKPGGSNGYEWLAAMEEKHGPLPATARSLTANGGMHLLFKYVDGVRNRGALGAGVDIRGEGGYIIMPGSVMADGREYRWADKTREIADAPDWLLDLLKPKTAQADTYRGLPTPTGSNHAYVDASVDAELRDLAAVPMGAGRNNALNDSAFALGRWVGGGHISESDARAWLQDVARGWGRDWAKCCKTIENGLKAGIMDPRHPPEPSAGYEDNTRPIDPELIKRFIENSERKQEARATAAPKTSANDNVPPASSKFSIFDWPSSRYVGEPPVIKELVEGTIPQAVPGMIAAMGDTGKSYAALELHRRVSFGSSTFDPPIFGGRVLATGTSVMVTSEDDAGEVHRRLAALDQRGHRLSEGGKMLVVPLPSAGGPQVFWREDRKLGLIETDSWKRLCEELVGIEDLRLVTLDPLASFAHVQINEDPAAGAFVCASLGALAAETRATVLVAHQKKTAKPIEGLADAREAIRGSTALVDGLRLAYALWPAEEKRARAICKDLGVEYTANRVVFGGVVKANGAARRIVSTYVRNEFGLLVDRTSGIGSNNAPQEELIEHLVAAIASAAHSGQPLTKTGATGLFENRERLGDSLSGLSRHKIEALANQAIERQLVVKCIAGGTIAKWLDVPTGSFAKGLGNFRKGMARG